MAITSNSPRLPPDRVQTYPAAYKRRMARCSARVPLRFVFTGGSDGHAPARGRRARRSPPRPPPVRLARVQAPPFLRLGVCALRAHGCARATARDRRHVSGSWFSAEQAIEPAADVFPRLEPPLSRVGRPAPIRAEPPVRTRRRERDAHPSQVAARAANVERALLGGCLRAIRTRSAPSWPRTGVAAARHSARTAARTSRD